MTEEEFRSQIQEAARAAREELASEKYMRRVHTVIQYCDQQSDKKMSTNIRSKNQEIGSKYTYKQKLHLLHSSGSFLSIEAHEREMCYLDSATITR